MTVVIICLQPAILRLSLEKTERHEKQKQVLVNKEDKRLDNEGKIGGSKGDDHNEEVLLSLEVEGVTVLLL